jgi:hypothetical protein
MVEGNISEGLRTSSITVKAYPVWDWWRALVNTVMNIRILVPRSYLVSWHTQYASTSDNEIFIEMEPMSSETHTEALELPYTKVMLYEKQFLSNAPLYRVMHYSELDYKVGLLVLLSTTS